MIKGMSLNKFLQHLTELSPGAPLNCIVIEYMMSKKVSNAQKYINWFLPEGRELGPRKHASNQDTCGGYGDARDPPEDPFDAGGERRVPGHAMEPAVDETYESKSDEEWEIVVVVLKPG